MSLYGQFFQKEFPDSRWALALGLGVLIYLAWTINDFGFGHDEAWTTYYASPALSFGELFQTRLIGEPHPPLYYLLTHLWAGVFGVSEIALRSFSLLSFTVILGVFWWSRRRQILGAAASPFLFLIVTSWSVWWSVPQARMYGWLIAAAVILTVLCIKSVLDHRSGRRPGVPTLICMFMTAVFAAFMHYFGTLFAGSMILVLFAYFSWNKDFRSAGAFLAMGAAILALFGTWLWFSLPDLSLRFGGEFWIPFTPVKQTLLFLERSLSRNPVLMVLAALCLLAGLKVLRNDIPSLMLLGVTALGVAIAFLISLHTPLIFWKYLFPFLPPLAYVAGRAIAAVSRDNFPAWMWLAVFALSVGLNVQNHPKPLENYRDSARYVRAHWTEECRGAPVIALPTPGSYVKAQFWPQSFYLEDLDIRFLRLTDENLRKAKAHECPLAIYLGRIYPPRLSNYLSGLGIDPGEYRIVPFGRTHLLYKQSADMKKEPSSP